jgi:hypothetical protein
MALVEGKFDEQEKTMYRAMLKTKHLKQQRADGFVELENQRAFNKG